MNPVERSRILRRLEKVERKLSNKTGLATSKPGKPGSNTAGVIKAICKQDSVDPDTSEEIKGLNPFRVVLARTFSTDENDPITTYSDEYPYARYATEEDSLEYGTFGVCMTKVTPEEYDAAEEDEEDILVNILISGFGRVEIDSDISYSAAKNNFKFGEEVYLTKNGKITYDSDVGFVAVGTFVDVVRAATNYEDDEDEVIYVNVNFAPRAKPSVQYNIVPPEDCVILDSEFELTIQAVINGKVYPSYEATGDTLLSVDSGTITVVRPTEEEQLAAWIEAGNDPEDFVAYTYADGPIVEPTDWEDGEATVTVKVTGLEPEDCVVLSAVNSAESITAMTYVCMCNTYLEAVGPTECVSLDGSDNASIPVSFQLYFEGTAATGYSPLFAPTVSISAGTITPTSISGWTEGTGYSETFTVSGLAEGDTATISVAVEFIRDDTPELITLVVSAEIEIEICEQECQSNVDTIGNTTVSTTNLTDTYVQSTDGKCVDVWYVARRSCEVADGRRTQYTHYRKMRSSGIITITAESRVADCDGVGDSDYFDVILPEDCTVWNEEFTIGIQAKYADGSDNLTYVPSGNVLLTLDLDYTISPIFTDNTGWLSGYKAVTATIGGGGGTKNIEVTAAQATDDMTGSATMQMCDDTSGEVPDSCPFSDQDWEDIYEEASVSVDGYVRYYGLAEYEDGDVTADCGSYSAGNYAWKGTFAAYPSTSGKCVWTWGNGTVSSGGPRAEGVPENEAGTSQYTFPTIDGVDLEHSSGWGSATRIQLSGGAWYLYIYTENNQLLWQGTKTTGKYPSGEYEWIAGCNTSVETLTVEALDWNFEGVPPSWEHFTRRYGPTSGNPWTYPSITGFQNDPNSTTNTFIPCGGSTSTTGNHHAWGGGFNRYVTGGFGTNDGAYGNIYDYNSTTWRNLVEDWGDAYSVGTCLILRHDSVNGDYWHMRIYGNEYGTRIEVADFRLSDSETPDGTYTFVDGCDNHNSTLHVDWTEPT